MSKRNGRPPNHTRTPSPTAPARAAAAAELAQVRADYQRWDNLLCMDPEDLEPEDREWARAYWGRTGGAGAQ